MSSKPPLVYACSGCSSAAQLANDVALKLHRSGQAEMSCIAGVGGDVAPLVSVAKSGRPIIALDGCKLRCVHSTLNRHAVTPALQVDLGQLGVQKKVGADFNQEQAAHVLAIVTRRMARTLGVVTG